ncbi:MAG: hypothetical protein K0Q55_481, partial [Verrucomicrobia bacterium]|nr:hypothetical protein [Verrucomicrobiota bacterium]
IAISYGGGLKLAEESILSAEGRLEASFIGGRQIK